MDKIANIYNTIYIYDVLKGMDLGTAKSVMAEQGFELDHLVYAYMPVGQNADWEIGLLHENIKVPSIRVRDYTDFLTPENNVMDYTEFTDAMKKVLSFYELQPGVKNVAGWLVGFLEAVPGIMKDLGYKVSIYEPQIFYNSN